MTLKDAISVLLQFAERCEEMEKNSNRGPMSMDELAEALWDGAYENEFASKEEFKSYMHRLLKSDLLAKERQTSESKRR